VAATLEPLIIRLERELQPLVMSGRNWQLTLHGGRNGHIKLETLIVDELTLDPNTTLNKQPSR
jgi:hypothetical protein